MLYAFAGALASIQQFEFGRDPIFIGDVACTGLESRILSCRNTPFVQACTHVRDAGVKCEGQSAVTVTHAVAVICTISSHMYSKMYS